jgi:PAS domain S-box-containing protein
MPDRITNAILAEVVGIAADAIICIDDSQRVIFFNQGAEAIFGYTADEIIGQRIEVLVPERFRRGHEGLVQEFGRSGVKARRMGDRREISALRRSGEEFPAEAAISQIHHDGLVVYAVVLRDVTQRKRFEEMIQRSVQVRDDMVGIVSHDLRNPVAAVKMLAGAVLQNGSGDAADVRKNLELIRTAAQQMETLISDLLDVTRIEAGRLAVNLQPVDPNALVRDSISTLAPLAQEKKIKLVSELDEDATVVAADAHRIQQTLSNLVGNAIKFTPAGGRIRVTTRALPEAVEFSVSDTGPGIPGDQLAHIFERYWQSRRTERHGAGLGLPIAKGIVEAHAGSIRAESEPGKGTTLVFTLPRSHK